MTAVGDVLVTGGTGGLGRELVTRLLDRGHRVAITSRDPDAAAPEGVTVYRVDLRSGAGMAAAVAGAEVVVHAASTVRGAGKVEPGGARHLLEAIGTARPHLVYVSIVGVDRHRFGYYRAKWAAEQVLEAGSVPVTIQRSTQFHTLLHQLLGLPVSGLPKGATFQPIDTGEVADRLADLVEGEPRGRADDVGGPEVLGVHDLVDQWGEVFGRRPRCLPLPALGGALSDFAAGVQTCPDHRVGTVTWRRFLERRAAEGG